MVRWLNIRRLCHSREGGNPGFKLSFKEKFKNWIPAFAGMTDVAGMATCISRILLAVYFIAWFFYFAFFWGRSITLDDKHNLILGHINMWGDWAVHFTMGSAMAFRQLIPLTSPLLIGAPFHYPFLANLISAVLIRLGLPYFASFTIPSFIFCLGIIGALFFFYKKLFRSDGIAMLSSLLFLFNGGLGFLYFLKDFAHSTKPWQTFFNPPTTYTKMDHFHIHWVSVIDSMMIPQRAFQLGFPLALAALVLIYSIIRLPFTPTSPRRVASGDLSRWEREPGTSTGEGKNIVKLILAGFILGYMPIMHIHSIIALSVILPFWMIADLIQRESHILVHLKRWALLFTVTAILALPFMYLFVTGGLSERFMRWFPGWYAKEEKIGWLYFWFKNWGITPLMGLLGFWLLLKKQLTLKEKWGVSLIFSPFFILFALVNLFLFQPWVWDNTKMLVWASLGISGLAAYALGALLLPSPITEMAPDDSSVLQRSVSRPVFTAWIHSFAGRLFPRPINLMKMILGILLFTFMTASGAIDAYRNLRPKLHQYQFCTQEELLLVDWVKKNTPLQSLWLTGNHHNNWLFNFTGRQVLLAYPGWLWTHGYNFNAIEKDYRQMFLHPENKDLFKIHKVDYIAIGPNEVRELNASKEKFMKAFPLVKKTGNYIILATREDDPLRQPPSPVPAQGLIDMESLLKLKPGARPVVGLADLKTGLQQKIYSDKYFSGRIWKFNENSIDFNFTYHANQKRPFPTPCSMVWEGFINIPLDGTYTFALESDDGSRLCLNDYEIIDNGGTHGIERKDRRVKLTKGPHRIKIDYFDGGGGAILSFRWKPPFKQEEAVPRGVLYH
ncbi:MAG: hypothetical protein LHV69_05020 [Elusimicrobia bacterium]|nr:hypothetical protein [Candidatus Obscuribacterium magneticum]